jgi:mono/diheme cytochrome c family protein
MFKPAFKPAIAVAVASFVVFSVAIAQQGSKSLSPDAAARAHSLYTQECALCHGDTGNGKSDLANAMKMQLPDFTDSKSLAAKSDSDLFNTIRNGKGQMPAESSDRAKDDALRNLITYLRSLASQTPAAAPAAAPAAPAADQPAPAPPTPPQQ